MYNKIIFYNLHSIVSKSIRRAMITWSLFLPWASQLHRRVATDAQNQVFTAGIHSWYIPAVYIPAAENQDSTFLLILDHIFFSSQSIPAIFPIFMCVFFNQSPYNKSDDWFIPVWLIFWLIPFFRGSYSSAQLN